MNIKTEKWMDHEIRFVDIDGEWWGVAKDVADALGYSDTHAMTRHMNGKYLKTVRLAGVKNNATAISERGIYKAITRSQRPEAEAFEDWLFDIVKTLRKSSGLEGFEVFRMLDKEHQKEAMSKLRSSLQQPKPVSYIKANTIANKAISSRYGHEKMIKKSDMTPEMLAQREPILEDVVELMAVKDKFGLDLSVSDEVYKKYVN